MKPSPCPTATRRNVGQSDFAVAEPLQRLRNHLRTVVHPQHLVGPISIGLHPANNATGSLGHMLPFGGDRSALVSHRVTGRLHADQAVAKHKSVDAIVSVCCRGISGPLQEKQITIEDLGLQCPGCVR